MYYDIYPVGIGDITKNCVEFTKKKETTQLRKALDILLFSAAQGP